MLHEMDIPLRFWLLLPGVLAVVVGGIATIIILARNRRDN